MAITENFCVSCFKILFLLIAQIQEVIYPQLLPDVPKLAEKKRSEHVAITEGKYLLVHLQVTEREFIKIVMYCQMCRNYL